MHRTEDRSLGVWLEDNIFVTDCSPFGDGFYGALFGDDGAYTCFIDNDDAEIPETKDGRAALAKKIKKRARDHEVWTPPGSITVSKVKVAPELAEEMPIAKISWSSPKHEFCESILGYTLTCTPEGADEPSDSVNFEGEETKAHVRGPRARCDIHVRPDGQGGRCVRW